MITTKRKNGEPEQEKWATSVKIGTAVLLHEGSTLLVVFDALRLLAYQGREGT